MALPPCPPIYAGATFILARYCNRTGLRAALVVRLEMKEATLPRPLRMKRTRKRYRKPLIQSSTS